MSLRKWIVARDSVSQMFGVDTTLCGFSLSLQAVIEFEGQLFLPYLLLFKSYEILVFGVEGGVDDTSLGGADDGGEVVEARGGNGLHAAEGREEFVLRLRADALDVVEA